MTNKEDNFKELIESTTEMLNHNLMEGVISAKMLKDILMLFSDEEDNNILHRVGKQVYNKKIQEVASELLDLCFLDEDIENLN